MKRRTRLIVELLKAVAVVVVVVQLTVLAAFCFYGADGIARWDSWRPVAVVSCAFLALLAAIQYLRRRRESRPALILQTAAALGALAVFCVVVAMGKGLLPAHLGSPLDTAAAAARDGLDLVEAARRQIGVTVEYDPRYTAIPYPGGDVPRVRGVCSDVIVRALRDARGIDLQRLVHEDMAAHFLSYPSLTRWGLFRPDPNIDHRRVLNLERFFARRGWALAVGEDVRGYLPGDIVTCRIGGDLPHIMIVSDSRAEDGTPLALHNIGSGTREDNDLFSHVITGHFRIPATDAN